MMLAYLEATQKWHPHQTLVADIPIAPPPPIVVKFLENYFFLGLAARTFKHTTTVGPLLRIGRRNGRELDGWLSKGDKGTEDPTEELQVGYRLEVLGTSYKGVIPIGHIHQTDILKRYSSWSKYQLIISKIGHRGLHCARGGAVWD